MSKPILAHKFLTLARDEWGRSPSRADVRLQVRLETLEGRTLLSQVVAQPTAVAAQVGTFTAAPKRPHPGPIVNNFGVGYAVKSPRFYELYSGALRPELNAAGMKATYDAAGDLVLTGIVAGKITTTPAADAGSEYYFFGINRGTNSGTNPFPNRPRIKFDAVVAVGFTPTGVSGSIIDLTDNTVTPIDPSGILNQEAGQDVKVYVPAGTPGISPVNGMRPTVVFWAQDTAPTSAPHVASFAPEGRNVPIAGGAGSLPLRHLV